MKKGNNLTVWCALNMFFTENTMLPRNKRVPFYPLMVRYAMLHVMLYNSFAFILRILFNTSIQNKF